MVPILSLWLPILIAAVFVFFLSFIIHMVLSYHRSDYGKLPSEAEVQDALRKFAIAPGDYMLPCAGNPAGMKRPEFIDMINKGPVILMTVMKPGPVNMGQNLMQWFLYCILVGVLAAYITGRALPPGAPYLHVFRMAGATSFFCYSIAMWQDSIWYKRKWSTTLKNTFDGLVYACFTAGTFGWLWPR